MTVSRKRTEIIATMKTLVASGEWTAISGNTIRWSERDLVTPEWAQKQRPLNGALWPSPTYDRHVFVTFYAHAGSQPIIGVSPAPWVGRRDSSATLTRVAALLADPRSAFDLPAQP